MSQTLSATQNPRLILYLFIILAAFIFIANRAAGHHYNIKDISVSEAKVLIDSWALVIDVRKEDAFRHRHIPGALSIPLEVLRNGIPASLAQAKDKPVVVYCGDGVTTGPEGTHILNKAGYNRAVNIKTGIDGWSSAGLPVQR
jgi:rhodanese-related sulfurtransferase